MLYEGVILFGIVFIAGYLFSTLTQQRNGLTHHNLLAAWVGFVVGAYFVWFWTHGGQTLGMRAWRLQLVREDGARIGWPTAMLRFAVAIPAWLIGGLGMIWCLLDGRSRSWQDIATGTAIQVLPKT